MRCRIARTRLIPLYQLCLGADHSIRENCGITDVDYYGYLNTTDVRIIWLLLSDNI